MPMPRITCSIRSAEQAASVKTPASFLLFTKISLGHLIIGAYAINGAKVSTKATAAIKVICGACFGANLGRRMIDK
jgi:hypothetical protein